MSERQPENETESLASHGKNLVVLTLLDSQNCNGYYVFDLGALPPNFRDSLFTGIFDREDKEHLWDLCNRANCPKHLFLRKARIMEGNTIPGGKIVAGVVWESGV